jgi:hypothetical protein
MSGRFFAECRFAPCSETDRLAVRHGLQTLHEGRLFRESFAPGCWLPRETPATVQLSHDGEVVGEIGAVIAHKDWHLATLVLEDRPIVRERFKPGARISVGAKSIRRDQDDDLRIVRHRICQLEHIAPLLDGQTPGHIGAKITRVWEPTVKREPSTRDDWRALLPAGWQSIAEIPGDDAPVELIHGRTVAYRWTGEKFAAV